MKTIEVHISDIIIQHPEINSFVELMDALRGITSRLSKCYFWILT